MRATHQNYERTIVNHARFGVNDISITSSLVKVFLKHVKKQRTCIRTNRGILQLSVNLDRRSVWDLREGGAPFLYNSKPFFSSKNSLNVCFHAIGVPISSYLAVCLPTDGLEIRPRGFREWSILVFADEAIQLVPRKVFFTVACHNWVDPAYTAIFGDS